VNSGKELEYRELHRLSARISHACLGKRVG